jgi:deoxyribodipyrimidine photo-lyase
VITNIFLFRNDLRIEDNPALIYAINQSDYVIPIYIIDKTDLEDDRWGFPKIGIHRRKFIYESLIDLKNKLKSLGSDLLIEIGDSKKIIQRICENYFVQEIFATREITSEELSLEEEIRGIAKLNLIGYNTLYQVEELPFKIENLPKHFTDFRKKIEYKLEIDKCEETPLRINSPSPFPLSLESLDIFFNKNQYQYERFNHFIGGSVPAFKRVSEYFWETRCLSNYKITRNEITGDNFSSKLSPFLSKGCISAKQIYWYIKKYEAEVEENESTYWLYFELLWRDYFKFVALEKQNKLFFKNGWSPFKIDFSEDMVLFDLWRHSKTNETLINVFLKELKYSGFMSNRGRQIVSSHFTKELKIDWRMGAAWFESNLIDYDVCSNYGNWAYQAGVGNDPRKDRSFNLKIQQEKFDPYNKFIDFWEKEK